MMAAESDKIPQRRAQLKICLLNYFHVEVDGRALPSCGPKADTLLSLLGLRRECRASRADIQVALWPDTDDCLATQNLNSLNSNLKKALGPQIGGQPPVIAEDGTYRLNTEAGIVTDIALFDDLSERSMSAMRSGDLLAAKANCDHALAIYRGNLHTRETGDYLMQFERLRTRYLSLLAWSANWHSERSEWSDALALAYRMLSEDECREDAHRVVMQSLMAQGQRTQALRQFKLCAELLHREFDAMPEPATQLLYDSLRHSGDAIRAALMAQ